MANISFYSPEESSNQLIKLLKERLPEHSIRPWPSTEWKPEDVHYAVCWHPPEHFFDGTSQLQAILSLAAGVDHVLDHPHRPLDVPLIRLHDAGMADKIAEYVHYGVLRAHRHFDHYQHLQLNRQWQPKPDRDAKDFKVGIMGFGVIGKSVAHHLHKNGYQVTAWKRSASAHKEPFEVFHGSIKPFISDLDMLVCVLPLTEQTKNIVNHDLLSLLPTGAHFINVGRGLQVVEDDLLQALTNGKLQSALLDVCVTEPLPSNHPFWTHPRVTITPHVAGPTQLEQSISQIADSINALEAGKAASSLPGWVDTAAGY